MDPLSALRIAASPELRGQLPIKAPEAAPIREGDAIGNLPGLQPASGKHFDSVLGDMIRDVNDKQVAAQDAVNGMLTGQNVSLHQTMIAMEEASVSFQLMVEVRNKLLESYQELMRMQI